MIETIADDKKTIYAVYVKNKGYYVTFNPSNDRYERSDIFNYLINDRTIEKSFHQNWGFVQEKPEKLSYYKKLPNINYRFELIDKEIKGEKVPLVFEVNKVAYWDEYEYVWKEEFKHLQSLYELKYDKQPDIEIILSFNYKELFNLDSLEEPKKISYLIKLNRYGKEEKIVNTEIQHQDLDKIIFPSLLIHQTPCKLTPKQSYNIIREHIKRNIDLKVAEITSDYDFCFEVSKIIPLLQPIEYKVDLNAFSKKKPKIVTRVKTDKKSTCFEMTSENYKGYTQIEGFEGKNEDDLKQNIDFFLKNLMVVINTPLKTCDKCNGKGVLFNEV